ncbi:MAG: carbohydrate kinase family protein [Bacteroidota bacterium]
MTITVIGHLCLDVINHADGTETQSHGGIFFSLAALANLLGDNDKIYPVFGVGRADYDELMERLIPYSNIDPSGIYKFNGPTNHVHLQYTGSAQRIECSKDISEPIPLKKIRPYLDSNMILINMISGFDLLLDTMDEIRMEVRDEHTPIYLDVHSLTLGIKEDCTRYHRALDTWRRWLFMIHGAQMNEEEAAILSSERFEEPALAKHALALNTRAMIVTRGQNGCTAYIDTHKTISRHDIKGIDTENAVDPTGCGDVFAAAYCAHYLSSKDILASAEFANRVAAFKTQFAGSEDIDKLSAFRIPEHVQ